MRNVSKFTRVLANPDWVYGSQKLMRKRVSNSAILQGYGWPQWVSKSIRALSCLMLPRIYRYGAQNSHQFYMMCQALPTVMSGKLLRIKVSKCNSHVDQAREQPVGCWKSSMEGLNLGVQYGFGPGSLRKGCKVYSLAPGAERLCKN